MDMNSMHSMTSATTTTGSCTPEHFAVPIFGGSVAGDGLANIYAHRSNQAHVVLGICMFILVFNWSVYLLEYIGLRRALRYSARLQFVMGAYLLSWLFYQLYPNDLSALHDYVLHDLLQLQHLSIAVLLVSCGIIEGLQANGFSSSAWSSLWSFNMTYIGLLFVAHPQHSYTGTLKHMILGMSICFAALLFGRAKDAEMVHSNSYHLKPSNSHWYKPVTTEENSQSDFMVPRSHPKQPGQMSANGWLLITAGAFFGISGIILVLFREQESVYIHQGMRTSCQPAWPLTYIGYILCWFSISICTMASCLHARRCQGLISLLCGNSEPDNCLCHAIDFCLCIKSGTEIKRNTKNRHLTASEIYLGKV